MNDLRYCEGCVEDRNPSPYYAVFTVNPQTAVQDDNEDLTVMLVDGDPLLLCYHHLAAWVIMESPRVMEAHITRIDPLTASPYSD